MKISSQYQKVTCLNCWKEAEKESNFFDYYCHHCRFSWDFTLVNSVLRMYYYPAPHRPVYKVPDGLLLILKELPL